MTPASGVSRPSDFDKRVLAGSVVTDNSGKIALLDAEGNVVKDRLFVVGEVDVFDFNGKRIGVHNSSVRIRPVL